MQHDERDPALDPALDQMTRRRFIEKSGMTAAAATGIAAIAGAQEPRKPAGADMIKEEVTLEKEGSPANAFLCRPRGGARRGSVIVVHEIFGVNDHIKDLACRFADAGFNGLAVNFFKREGNPPSAEGGFAPLMQFVGKIPDAQIMNDIRAAVDHLRSQPYSNGKVGLVGFCWGGRVAMLAAARVPELSASVAYYGRIRLPQPNERQTHGPMDLVSQIKVPLLGHFGALDQGIPVADVEAYRDALKKEGKTAEIHIYEGANHAFNNDTRESYHKESAQKAWQRTIDWFAKYLG